MVCCSSVETPWAKAGCDSVKTIITFSARKNTSNAGHRASLVFAVVIKMQRQSILILSPYSTAIGPNTSTYLPTTSTSTNFYSNHVAEHQPLLVGWYFGFRSLCDADRTYRPDRGLEMKFSKSERIVKRILACLFVHCK